MFFRANGVPRYVVKCTHSNKNTAGSISFSTVVTNSEVLKLLKYGAVSIDPIKQRQERQDAKQWRMLALLLSVAAHFRLISLINGLGIPLIDLVWPKAVRAWDFKQRNDWRMSHHYGGEPSNASKGRTER